MRVYRLTTFPPTGKLNYGSLPALPDDTEPHPERFKSNLHDYEQREMYGSVLCRELQELQSFPIQSADLFGVRHVCTNSLPQETIKQLYLDVVSEMVVASNEVFGTGKRKWQRVPKLE